MTESNTNMQYQSDHDLLISMSVKLDQVIKSLESKADKSEVVDLRRELDDVKTQSSRQWYWILGVVGSLIVTAGGVILSKVVGG